MGRLVPLLALAVVASWAVGPLASSLPTPAIGVSERVFPEARETTDYVTFAQFLQGVGELAQRHPDLLRVLEIGQSFGWKNHLTGAHDRFPVIAVELTNDKSPVPRDEKRVLVFQLSIHGNEKGGREGGMRVIEDLLTGRYYSDEYRRDLDANLLVFLFTNPDGWVHEQLEYRANCPDYFAAPLPAGGCVESQNYVRFNGNGVDLNRDFPTVGWYNTAGKRGHALREPEIAAVVGYLQGFGGRVVLASDIHGMLAPADGEVFTRPVPVVGGPAYGEPAQCLPRSVPVFGGACLRNGHFALSLLRDAQAAPSQHLRTLRFAELLKERLDGLAAERYPYWYQLPNLGVAGGSFNQFGTTWDTIGYADSGTAGSFFVQALGATGFTVEMSYNHITFDNHYLAELNDIHVHVVREIVRAGLDHVRQPSFADVRTNGLRAAYLLDPIATESQPKEGPHLETTADDAFERQSRAEINAFFADMARVLDGPLAGLSADRLAAELSGFDVLVVPSRASDALVDDPAAIEALRAFVESGGRLVLTDSALRLLESLGAVEPGSVEETLAYAGYADFDRSHPLARDLKGLARETYGPLPLGYPVGGGGPASAPVWTVASQAVASRDGTVAGASGGPAFASFGEIPLGKGRISFLGALLAPPTSEHYHPYGLASYALSANGFQILYNALGFTLTESDTQRDLLSEILKPSDTDERRSPVPSVEPLAALSVLALLALAAGRRRT